jgi:3-deoxy-D-manno-octulosonic-acid transferase
MTLLLWNLLHLLLSPFVVLGIIYLTFFNPHTRRGLLERLGFISKRKLTGEGPVIWLHAATEGETVAARPVWPALLAALPGWRLVHSTMTDTGQAEAIKAVGDAGSVIYFPYDLWLFVKLALSRVRPRLIVLVETELWPNFLWVARSMGCRVMLVNGRISERSLTGGRRAPGLYRFMTDCIDRFCMQSREDAERIIALGADPARVTVTGNTKFDQNFGEVTLGEQIALRNSLGIGRDEPVVVAGSTHPGEEEVVLRAFRHVKTAHIHARLIIAPRDITRAAAIEELAAAHGFTAARRTKLGVVPTPPDAIIILDTIGELARAYALGTSAFVGGSLVPTGGHNILECLAHGRPVLFGPQMSNFRDIAAIAIEAGVGFQVNDDVQLAARWEEYIGTARRRRDFTEKAVAVFQQHRGASRRTAEEAAHLMGVASTVKVLDP